jgi:hypothetical protein
VYTADAADTGARKVPFDLLQDKIQAWAAETQRATTVFLYIYIFHSKIKAYHRVKGNEEENKTIQTSSHPSKICFVQDYLPVSSAAIRSLSCKNRGQ